MWGRLAACAAVGYRRRPVPTRHLGRLTRPQLAKLPHKTPRCLAYTYARIQAVLLMNRLGVHFCVAHPINATSLTRGALALQDRKSTRLNSSHLGISYAVF